MKNLKMKSLKVFAYTESSHNEMGQKRSQELFSECKIADSILSRAKGLLGRKKIDKHEALLIVPCRSIHMWGMRFSIDALFLSREENAQPNIWKILKIAHELKPSKFLPSSCITADAVLEVASGRARELQLKEGDFLCIA